ncbi:hypothetical protein NBRC116583_20910 [Arenicella sp. 4NH20-0111]
MRTKQRWLALTAATVILVGCKMSDNTTVKYDPNLLQLTESKAEDTTISLILGLSEVVDEKQIEELKESGLQVRSVIGDIVTGQSQIKHLSKIAALEYVLKVEASREMDIDSLDNILE